MKKFLVILSVFAVAVAMSGIAYAQEKAPTTVILKGSPMGGVKFDHAKHSKMEGVKCEQCHHASKPEKPSKTAHEECQGCHTKAATAPMKTDHPGRVPRRDGQERPVHRLPREGDRRRQEGACRRQVRRVPQEGERLA